MAHSRRGNLTGWILLAMASALFLQSCGGSGSSGGGGGQANPPSAPTGLTATAGNQQVSLTWSVSSGAASYNVKRATATGGPYTTVSSPTANSYTNTGLTNGTTYYYVVTAVNANGESGNSSEKSATPLGTTAVSVTVDVLTNRHVVSPYIYGTNFPNDANYISDSGTTMVRWGGNASTRYNWVNFNTNAANDYYFVNRPMGNPPLYSDSIQFVTNVKAAGGFPLMTIGLLPWVAKDASSYSFSASKYGYTPCHANPNNSDDGNGVQRASNCDQSPVYVTGNDPKDAHVSLLDQPGSGDPPNSVYRNQWVTALATAFGSSLHFYNMDNEYDIWSGTHRDVHPNGTTYTELRDTFVNESRAVKGWDPLAVRFGPVSCCWYFYWNSAAGGSDRSSHAGIDFFPWWLNEVAWEDAVAGSRSLDVFDVHAYTEASANGLTAAQAQALALRIPRDWWDSTYTSEAWFGTNTVTQQQPLDSKAFRIPRLRAWVNAIYPGTPLSFTEWNFAMAGEPDFSTALADVDAWGILGRERVSYSSRWTAADPANPAYNSLKLFRNYDGAHHGFGTTSVSATNNSDPNLFSTYAAVDSTGKTLTVMVVNKDPGNMAQVQFALNGFTASQVTAYTLSVGSPTTIVASSSQTWSASQNFAPYSATLLVITGTTASTPASEWDLNPDTTMVAAGGSVTLQPKITSGTASVSLGAPQSDTGITLTVTQGNLTTSLNGAIKVVAGNTPGFYHYAVSGTDSSATQTQGGWIVVGKPAATLAKTSGDGQTGSAGSTLPLALTVTLTPGQSGGTNPGASILFTASAGSLSNGTRSGPKVIAVTNSSGVASVTLTLPSTAEPVTVTAEGPYALGHPVAAMFSETSQ